MIGKYTLSVKREFEAYHFLTSVSSGPESERHAHRYEVTALLEGSALDGDGYLFDIVLVEGELAKIAGRYAGQVLNDLPEFSGLNPSIEHFARIVCQSVSGTLLGPNIRSITVTIAENRNACASYCSAD